MKMPKSKMETEKQLTITIQITGKPDEIQEGLDRLNSKKLNLKIGIIEEK